MRVSVQMAEGRLSQLIEAAARGEDIVLAEGEVPVARIVPIKATPFRLGILADRGLGPGPDFFEPMSGDDLDLWEGGRGRPSSSTRMPGHGA